MKSLKSLKKFILTLKKDYKMKKRGSHVGMVLSFVVFVTFLIFLYTILEPAITTEKDKNYLLEYLQFELLTNLSADLTIVTISSDSSKCLKLLDSDVGVENNLNFIVKDENDNIVDSEREGEFIKIEKGDFFKVYYSKEPFLNFSMKKSNCISPSIDLVRTKEYIYESKIISLINEYNLEYNSLKESLGIPIGSEFGFSFKNASSGVIGTEEKNISISVYAEEIPIQYIDSKADILPGFITIKVW